MHAIVNFQGGMGNQLFQYAFAQFLRKKRWSVSLNASRFRYGGVHDGFLINHLFEHNLRLSWKKASSIHPRDFELWKIFQGVESVGQSDLEATLLLEQFLPKGFAMRKKISFEGYWQYYQIANLVQREMNQIILPTISPSEFKSKCFIHIRGGDYFSTRQNKLLYDVISKDYYSNALKIHRANNPKQQFILFTNDLALSKRILGEELNSISIDDSPNSIHALAKMRACTGAIIANSSFSWWGAFLQRDKGIQIAPAHWTTRQTTDENHIYPPYMIRL